LRLIWSLVYLSAIGFACLSEGSFAESNANHSRWLPVGTTTTGAVTRFDAETVDWDGTLAKVWVDTDYSKDKSRSYRSSKSHMEINCVSKEIRTTELMIYAPNGTISQSMHEPDSTFAAAVPDSIGESIVRGVCSFAKVAPYGVEPSH
jgi:hypothetical protein